MTNLPTERSYSSSNRRNPTTDETDVADCGDFKLEKNISNKENKEIIKYKF